MGRFYKTAKGEFVENKMYQPPIELMAQVIANTDKQIMTNETALASLYDKLQAQGLAVDNPRLQEIIGDYRSQIDDMAAKIQQNPLEFRRETANIRNLGRSIADNWGATGEVGVIQQQLANRTKYATELQEKVKDGKILQKDADNALMLFDYNYNKKGGNNYQGLNKYNQYNTENLTEHVDSLKYLDEFMKGWQSDQIGQGYAYSDGKWINEGTKETKYVKPKDIYTAAYNAQLNNRPMMDYYQQQVSFYNQSGGVIGMSPQEVEDKIVSDATILASKYGYSQTSEKKNIKADDYTKQAIDNQNDINKKYLDHELDKQLEDYKNNLSNIKEIGTSSRGAFMTDTEIQENNNTIKSVYSELSNYLGIKLPIGKDGKYNPAEMRASIYAFRDRANASGDKENIKLANQMKANFDYVNSLMGKTKQEASWASALNIMSSTKVIAAKKDVETATKDPTQLMNIKQDWVINGKVHKNKTFHEIYKWNPKAFSYNGEAVDINELFNQGSIRPIIKSSTDYNKNKMNMTWNIPGLEIESNTSWTNFGISQE